MKSKDKVLILSVAAALSFWILDASVDHYLHYDEPFLTLLLFHKKEVAFRLLFSFCLLLFGLVMARAFSRQSDTEEALKKEIADHMHSRESLLNSLQQQRAILNNIPDLAWLKDKESRFISVNEPFGKACGVKPEDLIGKTDFDIWPDDLAEAYRADDREVMASGRTKRVEEPLIDSADKMSWIETIKKPIYDTGGEIIGTTGIARDVTERKRAFHELEEYRQKLASLVELRTTELRISNRKLQEEILSHEKSESDLTKALIEMSNIMSAVPDIIYMLDRNARLVKWNKTLETVSGYSPAELQGKHVFELMTEADRDEAYERIKEAFEKGHASKELRVLTKAGNTIPYFFSGAPYRDGSGNIIGLVGVGKDMTGRRAEEEKINFLASIVQTIPEGVCSIDLNGAIRSWNDGAEKMLGYASPEIIGKHVSSIIPEKLAGSELENCISILNAEGYFTGYESLRKAKSGEIVPVEITAAALKDKGQNIIGYASIMRDISERKKMEEDILRTQKLESLGILAGGIAHDFNNLLTAVLGNISLTKRSVDSDPAAYGILLDAEKALYRAKDLTHQLLTFSKGGTPVKRVTSLERLVSDAAEFALRGSNVISKFHVADNLRNIEVDEGQLSQVFYNLIINARQAMPKGGTITIRCGNASIGKNSVPPLKKGEYAKVSIEDRGSGIPQENLHKIFDPYFTTKQEGSGLGLATSYSIIKNHDGHITVESRPGMGTTFSIYLPATDKKLPENIRKGKTLFRGRGRVLVMDDEETIRLILKKMIAEIGYEADFAVNGEQTIDLYVKARESGNPFDAVLIDLTIRGGMGGQECIHHLLESDPEVKAIVSSGYSDAPVIANYRDYGFIDIITKPYQIEDLSEVLYKVINGIYG